MLTYVLRRFASIVPVVLIVAFAIFALLNWAGGDPALLMAGESATAEQIDAVRQAYGLDHSFPVRYVLWLWNVVHGDLGTSLATKQPVTALIIQRLEPTIALALTTLAITVLVAVPLGIAAAWRRGSWIDALVGVAAVAGYSVPIFVLAYFAIYLFAIELRWLPVQGYASPSQGLVPFLRHMAIPATALSFGFIGWIAKVTRDSMLEVLSQDFVRTAVAKGAGVRRILLRHALRNAAAPVVTVIGLSLALLMGGVVVTETVFAIPGLGRLTVDAIGQRDYPVIQGVVLFSSATYILVNLLVDVSYVLIDPRVRY